MIANYKPAGRAALPIAVFVIVLLCCLTFTGAAEKKAQPAVAAPPEAGAEARSTDERGMDSLKKEMAEREEELRRVQERVDKLQGEMGVSELMEVGDDARGAGGPGLGRLEAIRRYEAERINAEAELRQLEWMWKSLSGTDFNQLRDVMDIAVPDELLTSLLKSRAEGEQRLASLGTKFGPDHSEVRAAREQQSKVGEQIDRRIHGILAGMRLKIDARRAQIESLREDMDRALAREAKMAQAIRPYLDAKRELERLQKVRDAIRLRLLQEQIDNAVSRPERRQ